MTDYVVRIPITGYVIVEVEAESEEEAIEKAFNSEILSDNIEEWELHQQVVTGNVYHGMLNSIEIEKYQ